MSKILVIEDELDFADLLRDILEASGYAVEIACDGREGLSKVGAIEPDLVITDVMMPGLDGLELIDALRGTPSTEALPVIAMSAADFGQHQPFLRKPFGIEELLETVRRLLESPPGRGEGGEPHPPGPPS